MNQNNQTATALGQNPVQKDFATLLGGTDLEVKLLDGSTEKVRVRQLPVRLMPELLKFMDHEPELVELLCNKPAGWSDSVHPDSFEEIVICGEKLNNDFFMRWVLRRSKRIELLSPGLPEKILTHALESQITSQK